MAVSGQREIKPGKTDDKHVEGKNDSKKHELQAEFRIGEQVLCYEPDPSKAKMLYEAKLLEVDVTKDEKGNKVPEFFIHFIGWNKSWDRWVLSDSVLKDSETNRSLQAKLYEKALGPKKRPRARKRKQDDDFESIETNSQSNQSTANSSQAEGEESSDLPVVCISIPHILKCKLEDDCYLIKRRKRLLKLPRAPSALKILTDFLEFCELHEANESLNEVSYLRNVNIEIVREMVQGLQTYLNFTLSALLLYNFEREQYSHIFPDKQFTAIPSPLKLINTKFDDTLQNLPATPSESSASPRKKRGRRFKRVVSREKQEKCSGAEGSGVGGRFSSGVLGIRNEKLDHLKSPPRRRGRPSLKRKLEPPVSDNMPADGQVSTRVGKPTEFRISANVVALDKVSRTDSHASEAKAEQADSDLGPKDHTVDEAIDSSQVHGTTEKREMMHQLAVEQLRSINSEAHPRPSSKSSASKEQHAMPVGASASSMMTSETTAPQPMTSDQMQDLPESLSRCISKEQESSFSPFPLSAVDSKSPAEIYGAEHLLRLFGEKILLVSIPHV
eukprot:gene420-10090_t